MKVPQLLMQPLFRYNNYYMNFEKPAINNWQAFFYGIISRKFRLRKLKPLINTNVMKQKHKHILIVVLFSGMVINCFSQASFITDKTLRDKIAGGWAGKMIGVTYGAPVEFRAQGKTFDDPITWQASDVKGSMWQDDLYVQLTFLMTMDQYGLDAPAKIFQEMFAKSGYPLWHANVQARKNYFDQVYPPESGMPEYNLHADDIDFQIESDYLGLMCPGMPKTASEMASRIGHIMNYGDGVYGGVFLAALYTSAFFEDDVQKIVEQALLSIPAQSAYAETIRDVILLHQHYPSDWKSAWKELYDKWGKENICEAGSTFNIDAKINGAFVVMGLLYGDGDPLKTMEISARCGQDADCNPSSAMAVVGVIKGFSALPVDYQDAVKAVGDSIFINTNYSFNKAVEQTHRYAHELASRNGGKSMKEGLELKIQQAEPLPYECAFPEVVFKKRVGVSPGDGWNFKGNWQNFRSPEDHTRYSGIAGDELSFSFNGTGVSIMGHWLKTGGKADVFVDNVYKRTIDCYFHYALQEHENIDIFHVLNLDNGDHTIRLVVKGEKRPESEDSNVYVSGAIIYSTAPKTDGNYRFSFQN
jgi:hypothetical protein